MFQIELVVVESIPFDPEFVGRRQSREFSRAEQLRGIEIPGARIATDEEVLRRSSLVQVRVQQWKAFREIRIDRPGHGHRASLRVVPEIFESIGEPRGRIVISGVVQHEGSIRNEVLFIHQSCFDQLFARGKRILNETLLIGSRGVMAEEGSIGELVQAAGIGIEHDVEGRHHIGHAPF